MVYLFIVSHYYFWIFFISLLVIYYLLINLNATPSHHLICATACDMTHWPTVNFAYNNISSSLKTVRPINWLTGLTSFENYFIRLRRVLVVCDAYPLLTSLSFLWYYETTYETISIYWAPIILGGRRWQ